MIEKRLGKAMNKINTSFEKTLKDNLWELTIKNVNKEDFVENTLNHMNELSKQTNQFSVETAVKYANHNIDFVNKYNQYLAKSNGKKSDNKIGQLIDYLDYLWYLRDTYMDDNLEQFLNRDG